HGNTTPDNDTGWTTGKYGYGMKFEGSSDYVEIADHNSLRFGSGDFSVEVWFKTNSVSTEGVFVAKNVDNEAGSWLFGHLGDDLVLQMASGNPGEIARKFNHLQVDRWYHAVAVYEANATNKGKLYLDGGELGLDEELTDSTTQSSTRTVTLGKRQKAGDERFYNGKLDEVRIYKRALAPEEIRTHYLRGKGFGASGAITANEFRIVNTSGNVDFIKDSAGNVGIGTTEPQSDLHISGSSGVEQLTINTSGTGGGDQASLRLGAARAGSGSANIYLGEGRQDGTSNNKAFLLQYDANTDRLQLTEVGGEPIFRVMSGINAIEFTANLTSVANKDLTLNTTGGGAVVLQPSEGNVGIGTTSPGQKLTIDSGSVNISNRNPRAFLYLNPSAVGGGEHANITYPSAVGGEADLARIGMEFKSDSSTDFHLSLREASSTSIGTPFFVDGSSGNVGIGTTTPTTALEIFSTSAPQLNISYDATRFLTISNQGYFDVHGG
ncbi:MAG: LamG domain-containing protein, partial [Anaerolineales bacterium]|nr:LamG domain-containing protein [Anaerolineales bacterium]